jgi:hypothetical protein
MAVPISFPATTKRFALPLLFAGQAQKEFFLNQAFVLNDALLHCTVLASAQTPPEAADEAACYRVTGPASGEWAGHEGDLAIRLGEGWQFVVPQPGMTVFDIAADAAMLYRNGWQSADEPALPSGGAVIDAEARQAIFGLIEALRKLGAFPNDA